MRIVVAEDLTMMRDEITRSCRHLGHLVVAESEQAEETLSLCRRLRPDVLLLDARLTDGDGLRVVEQLRLESSPVKIIVITAYTTAYFINRLAKLSVDGFIDKTTQKCAAIREALNAVIEGRKWFSPSFHEAFQKQKSDPDFFDKLLTAREQEVLEWISHGLSDLEIAAQLGVAMRTVEWHRSNLLHKLSLDSTAKLMAFAMVNGFAPGGALGKVDEFKRRMRAET